MSANFSINGTPSNGGERTSVEGQARVKSTDLPAAAEASLLPVNLQSAKDLKSAELRGEYVSVSDEQLIKAIDRAVKAMQGHSTSLDFSVHEQTKRIMVKVIDKENGKILREIPLKKNLDFIAKVWEMAGILIDERR